MLVESANVLKSASTPLNLRPQLIHDSLQQQQLPLYCYTVAITAAIGGAILPNSCLYRADDSERFADGDYVVHPHDSVDQRLSFAWILACLNQENLGGQPQMRDPYCYVNQERQPVHNWH